MKKNIIVILSAIFTIAILNNPINVKAAPSGATLIIDYENEDFQEYYSTNIEPNLELIVERCRAVTEAENVLIGYSKSPADSTVDTFVCYNVDFTENIEAYVDDTGTSYANLKLEFPRTNYRIIKVSDLSNVSSLSTSFTISAFKGTSYDSILNQFETDFVLSNSLYPILFYNDKDNIVFTNYDDNKLIINGYEISYNDYIPVIPDYKKIGITFTPTYYPNSNDLFTLDIDYFGYPESYVQNICYYRSSLDTEWTATSCNAGADFVFSKDSTEIEDSLLPGQKDSLFYEAKIVVDGEVVAYNIFSFGENAFSYSDIFYITKEVDYPNSLEFIYHINNNQLPSEYVKPICYYMTSQEEEWTETLCSSKTFLEPTNGVTYYAKIEYNGILQDYIYFKYEYNPLLPDYDGTNDIDLSLMTSYVDKLIGKLPIIGDIYNFFTFFISYTPPEYEDGYSPLPPIDFDFMGISVYVPINWDLFLEYRPLIHTLIKLSFITHFILKLWNQVNRFLEKGL